MKAYGMADLKRSQDGSVPAGHVTVPRERGGCGNCHEVAVGDDGRAYIDCGQCAPVLIASHYGWSATPHGVPLTTDQIADRELADRDAKDHQNEILEAMTRAIVGQMAGFQAVQQQPSLHDQLTAMTAEERTALFASFGPAELPAAREAAPAKTAPPRTTRTPRTR